LLKPTAAEEGLSFWFEAATTSAMMSPAMSEQKIKRPLIVIRTAGSPYVRTMQLPIQRGATTKQA